MKVLPISLIKKVDRFFNSIGLWLDRKNKHSRWNTYSFARSWFGVTTLRADYIEFTSDRYASNVSKAHARGLPPVNLNEKKPEHHRKRLEACMLNFKQI